LGGYDEKENIHFDFNLITGISIGIYSDRQDVGAQYQAIFPGGFPRFTSSFCLR